MPKRPDLDLSRREADIAIRIMPVGVVPPDYLIGRFLGRMTASTYVHPDLLDPDDPENVSHLTWIGKNALDQDEKWIKDTNFPEQPVRHSIVNVNLLVEAARHRMGMAFMPCFLARDRPDIVQVPGASVVHHSDIWVLTHKDLRLSARMRVLRELIAGEFHRIRHQIDTSAPEVRRE